MITLNFNMIAALAGCLALLICCRVIWPSSRLRGLILAGGGCALIIGVTLAYTSPAQLLALAGVLLAIGLLSLILACLSLLAYTRRQRGPRYRPPRQMSDACSLCGKSSHVKHYEQGWLCRACAGRIGAKAA